MNFEVNAESYKFTRENGEIVEFSPTEISFLSHQLEKNVWRDKIKFYIDSYEDNLDFSEVTREEFIGNCLDTLEFRWECNMIGDDSIDYQEIVVDEAEDAEIWRD